MNCDIAGMIPDSGQYTNWLQGYMGQIPIGNEIGTNFGTQKRVLFLLLFSVLQIYRYLSVGVLCWISSYDLPP